MRSRQIHNLQDVVDWGLCTGCGACSVACTKGGVSLVNIESVGIRPRFESASCAACRDCLSVCPGYFVDAGLATGPLPLTRRADHEFGPALEIWEGCASDPEIRYQASSGGLLSALALYCLEKENMAFVLHTGMDDAEPWTNRTVQSRSRAEILSRAGSRYAPASPCDGLNEVARSDRPCVFIGKPCDAAGAALLRRERPELDRKLGLILTFFCAGTPSTRGTLDLMQSLECNPAGTKQVRYRGQGWPGRFQVLGDNGTQAKSLSYQESWGRLAKYRPLRCHLCPDGLGRVADIACGDAWEKSHQGEDPGRSIVLVRTERGRVILHRAIESGYVAIERVDADNVLAAQSNLLSRRPEIFGRLLAMRLLLVPVPKFVGFSLLRSWLRLGIFETVRTVLGTLRRLVTRGWWRRRSMDQPDIF
ncbi:MAG TPA: Coenzyme F420 hydrogenase/dehydrogenase, beta subunit C-terminal domain [Terriglobia bacterium]|nr:Coenzyme F420 hydrogenase/dehydrogenase, beta subunit C-terminal domain [Terriglobia bacterium]